MWATWVLAASFTILILAGFEIVPQWRKPYPESAMFQALLVLAVSTGWLIGIIPVSVAIHRGAMQFIPVSTQARWILVLAIYALTATAAVYAIAMGTARNAPIPWKAAALIAGLALPLAYGLYLRRMIR